MIEYRAYYDDNGNVLCYTCEDLVGKYIIIDADVFAQARHDMKIENGLLVRTDPTVVVTKLVPSISGTRVSAQDMLVIVTSDEPDTKFWDLKTYE